MQVVLRKRQITVQNTGRGSSSVNALAAQQQLDRVANAPPQAGAARAAAPCCQFSAPPQALPPPPKHAASGRQAQQWPGLCYPPGATGSVFAGLRASGAKTSVPLKLTLCRFLPVGVNSSASWARGSPAQKARATRRTSVLYTSGT